MKKILVPTDFSTYAEQALKTAAKIAKKTDAEIILLHVVLAPSHVTVECSEENTHIAAHSDRSFFEHSLKQLQSTLREIIKELGQKKVSYQIRSGNITHTITDFIEKNEIDLVVMGTQGNSNYDDIFVGSNAEKVVRLSNCPVVTLRSCHEKPHFENIVFASDLEISARIPMEEILSFQELFNAKLHLLYVNTPANFQTTGDLNDKAEQFAKHYQLSNYNFYVYCDFIEDDGIHHFAVEIQADLVIVVSHKRRGFSRLLSGSVSEGVVHVSHIPVLTFSMKKA